MTNEIAIRALTTAALTGLLLGCGLRLEVRQVLAVMQQKGLLARTLAVNFLGVPALAMGIVLVFKVPTEIAVGMLLLAAAPFAPVVPVFDWLESLLRPFEDPQVALAYGKQRGGPASRFSENQVFTRWFPDVSSPRQAHPFCNNANAAIRRSLWEENPYDETLTGLEDIAWARWAIEAGYVIAYSAEAQVIHVHEEAPPQVYNRYRREAMAFKHNYPHEHFGLRDLFRLTSTNITSDIWHAARQKQLSSNWSSILWFRWMQFWGTVSRYCGRI